MSYRFLKNLNIKEKEVIIMKKTLKRIIAMTLAVAAIGTAAGCSSKKPSGDETAKIKWYLPADNSSNQNVDDIYAEATTMIMENIGVDVEFIAVPFSEYEGKMQILNAAAEQVDIMFVSNWANNYYTNISKNVLLPLDDLLAETPELYNTIPDYLWEGSKVNGKIYAVPNQQIAAREARFAIPKQNAKLLGINTEEYFNKENDFKATLEDCETYLRQLHSKTNTYAQLEKIWTDGLSLFGMEEVVGSYLPGAIRYSDGEVKLFNQYESDEFKYYINKRRQWVKDGLVQNEVEDKRALPGLTDENVLIPALLRVNTYKPGVEIDEYNEHKFYPEWFSKSKGYLTSGGITATMNGISATCKNPSAALKVLEYVNTDKEIYNLLSFGIEGVNYTKISDNMIKKNPDMPYYFANWGLGNVFNSYLEEGQAEDTWVATKEINDNAERSPLLGFNPNLDNLKPQVASCKSVIDEFLEALDFGIVDVDSVYPQFVNKLKASGADEIIAEVQKQIDEWQKIK